ncbi:EF-hand domain-containing protein [Mesorhizobium sp. SP-1A]|uniref:EF-hand domain-containing protein n=1 Tax=Mesorhizobium sp. SP-1A TaxID=3077840 RepID=UPI0028F6CB0E|nr:EF-hand domain-containing protein [Mesorhizobium sp. SP-1A]
MKRMILAAALSVMFAPLASAEGTDTPAVQAVKKHSSHMGMKQADLNEDGKIDIDEFTQKALNRAENTFTEIDKDGDGVITKDEYREFSLEKSKAMFKRMDRNGDGFLTSEDAQHRKFKKKSHKAKPQTQEAPAE